MSIIEYIPIVDNFLVFVMVDSFVQPQNILQLD